MRIHAAGLQPQAGLHNQWCGSVIYTALRPICQCALVPGHVDTTSTCRIAAQVQTVNLTHIHNHTMGMLAGESHFSQAGLASETAAGGATAAGAAGVSCLDSRAAMTRSGWPHASPTVVLFHLSATLPEAVLQTHFARYGSVVRVQLHPDDHKCASASCHALRDPTLCRTSVHF